MIILVDFFLLVLKNVGIGYAWQDHISFMLCDYRQIPTRRKYDRIISWLVLGTTSCIYKFS